MNFWSLERQRRMQPSTQHGPATHVPFNGRLEALISSGCSNTAQVLSEGIPQHREETGRATQRRSISSPPYALKTLNGPVKSMLIYSQRQIPAKPGKRRLSSKSPRSKIAASSPAHSHEALSPAAKRHDAVQARLLLKPTRTASSPKTKPPPMRSQTRTPASPATQRAQRRPAAPPLPRARWSAPPPPCV